MDSISRQSLEDILSHLNWDLEGAPQMPLKQIFRYLSPPRADDSQAYSFTHQKEYSIRPKTDSHWATCEIILPKQNTNLQVVLKKFGDGIQTFFQELGYEVTKSTSLSVEIQTPVGRDFYIFDNNVVSDRISGLSVQHLQDSNKITLEIFSNDEDTFNVLDFQLENFAQTLKEIGRASCRERV